MSQMPARRQPISKIRNPMYMDQPVEMKEKEGCKNKYYESEERQNKRL